MKKAIKIILPFALCRALLAGCGSEKTKITLRDVVAGDAAFTYIGCPEGEAFSGEKGDITLDEVRGLINPDNDSLGPFSFNVLDLDGDEDSDVVVNVYSESGEGGRLILWEDESGVLGYLMNIDRVADLKADGTFEDTTVQPSATEIRRFVSLSRDGVETETFLKANYDSIGEVTYTEVEGEEVDFDTYSRAAKEFAAAEYPKEYDFSLESIDEAFPAK